LENGLLNTNISGFILGITVLMVVAAGLARPAVSPVRAQSTGDTLRLPTATPTAQPTATPQPIDSLTVSPSPTSFDPEKTEIWEGYVAREVVGAGVPFARLLVQITGRDSQQIRLSTMDQVINIASTGQKPDEIGPNTVEFTGLTPGKYIIDALGLDTSLVVELKKNVETQVIFSPRQLTATSVPTATETNTPIPVTLASVITPASSPTPSATPMIVWIGAVTDRDPAGPSLLTVKIAGMESVAVQLSRTDGVGFEDQRCVTGQEGKGQDSCGFTDLLAGSYLVDPEGIDAALPLDLSAGEAIQVEFYVETVPLGYTGWQAQITKNSNSFLAQPRTDSTIRVRVPGRQGQLVALHSLRLGTVHYCEAVYNPAHEMPVCEFARLGPGVYSVQPLHRHAVQTLFVDGVGVAVIELLPATRDVELSKAVFGQGARPFQPQPTRTPVRPTPTASQLAPTAAPTPAPSPTAQLTNTPTPVAAWQGRVVEQGIMGAGAIGVRAVGLKDHPVILRSGSWQSAPQLTGTKPELGDYATEFGGLAQGEYIVELVDLAELRVNLGSGEFLLVEFRYQPVSTP
jgi:hypothetical protein